MERVNFYVDGYNFYFGLKQKKKSEKDWQRFYWLNFVRFFELFIGQNQVLQNVYYFTAPPLQPNKSNRQSELLEANKAINGSRFDVVKGQFYEKKITCKVCKSTYTVLEEKRTDVNLSIRMLIDCTIHNVDTIVLVSADSDFIPPLQFIREHYPNIKIRVYFPPCMNSSALSAFMKDLNKDVIRLENNKVKFNNSIMPDTISIDGISYTIPDKWKI